MSSLSIFALIYGAAFQLSKRVKNQFCAVGLLLFFLSFSLSRHLFEVIAIRRILGPSTSFITSKDKVPTYVSQTNQERKKPFIIFPIV